MGQPRICEKQVNTKASRVSVAQQVQLFADGGEGFATRGAQEILQLAEVDYSDNG